MSKMSLSGPLVEGHFAQGRWLQPPNLSHLLPVHAVRSFLFRQVHERAFIQPVASNFVENTFPRSGNESVLYRSDKIKIPAALLTNH